MVLVFVRFGSPVFLCRFFFSRVVMMMMMMMMIPRAERERERERERELSLRRFQRREIINAPFFCPFFLSLFFSVSRALVVFRVSKSAFSNPK